MEDLVTKKLEKEISKILRDALLHSSDEEDACQCIEIDFFNLLTSVPFFITGISLVETWRVAQVVVVLPYGIQETHTCLVVYRDGHWEKA